MNGLLIIKISLEDESTVMWLVKRFINQKSSSGAMKYLENTSWLLGEKVLRMIVSLFVGIWVARYLGPERFGLISYAQSFVALFAAIATFGLDNIVIKKLLKNEGDRDKLLGTSFVLKLVGAVLVLALLAVAVLFQSNDFQTNSLIFIIASATVFQSFNVIDFYFQSKVLSKFIVFSNLFSFILSSIIKVALILYEAPLITFAYVILFDSFILASGFIYFYLKRKLEILKWVFDKRTALSLLKESWPLIFSSIVVSIYMKVDQVMIQNMLGNEQVGLYSAAVRLSEVWHFIPIVICNSLFPAIINAKKNDTVSYINRMKMLYAVMIWGTLSVSIFIASSSSSIVELLYGKGYIAAGDVLEIHIWASIFVALSYSSGKWLIAEGLQKYSLYRSVFGLIINIYLNFLLIPSYGIVGAASATLITHVFTSLVIFAFVSQLRPTLLLMVRGGCYPFEQLYYYLLKVNK
jgi:O-antigen/teichoic acid export membrane protein